MQSRALGSRSGWITKIYSFFESACRNDLMVPPFMVCTCFLYQTTCLSSWYRPQFGIFSIHSGSSLACIIDNFYVHSIQLFVLCLQNYQEYWPLNFVEAVSVSCAKPERIITYFHSLLAMNKSTTVL